MVRCAVIVVAAVLLAGVGCAEGGSGEDNTNDPGGDVGPDTMEADVAPDVEVEQDVAPDTPVVDAPEITSFEVFQSSYSVGDTIRLEWSLSGGPVETLTLDQGVGDVTGETSTNLEVTGETTYQLTASNDGGMDTESLTLMPEPRGPEITNFGANTQTVNVGEPLTFAWSVTAPAGADVSCALDVEDDNNSDYGIDDCESQTDLTHTYVRGGGKTARLTATTANGDASKTVSITVNGSSQVVSNTSNAGQGSLRAAVDSASSGSVILFDLPSYPATIELESAITIDKDLTIRAPSLGDIVLSGRNSHRVFDLDGQGQVNLVLENLEMMAGLAPKVPSSNGGSQSTDGGLIRGQGTLTIENSSLHDSTSIDATGSNEYLGDGGCLKWSGDVSIVRSEFRDCVGHFGGAFYIEDSEATIEETTIASNHSPTSNAGCCFVNGTLDLIKSTVINNEVRGDTNNGQYGGAFYLQSNSSVSGPRGDGSSMFMNSTVAGNAATANGGAMLLETTLHIVFSTVTDNAADDSISGGGINSNNAAGAIWILSGEVLLHNSIVSGNSADEFNDIEGPVTTTGTNFVGDVDNGESPDLSGRVTTTSPQLGSLGRNGGQTRTILPQSGSPVIDAAPTCNDQSGSMVSEDQRAMMRPAQSACDVGSVEVQ
jgi:hypothetical protein